MGQAIAMRRFSAHRIRWIVGILILVVGTTLTAMHFNLHEPLAKRNFASTSLCFDTSGISDVLLNPVADRLFVATFDPSLTAVSIIDTRRNTVLKAVPVGTGNWVQLALRGTKLYAATSAPDNQIAVIDLDLDRARRRISDTGNQERTSLRT